MPRSRTPPPTRTLRGEQATSPPAGLPPPHTHCPVRSSPAVPHQAPTACLPATLAALCRWLAVARVGRNALSVLTPGTTPLVLAARLNHRECAAVLMDAAADLGSLAHSTITFITCPW